MRQLAFIFLILPLTVSVIQASFSGSIYAGMRYDSNVSQLSDYDLQRFSGGEKEFLLETSDDGIARIGATVRWKEKVGEFRLQSALFLVGAAFIRNNDKNYLWTLANFSIYKGGTRLKFSGNYVPRFRSRAYFDEDCDSTQWADYWSATGGIELRQRVFWGVYFGGQYEYRRAQYCDYFPEYDSNRHGFTAFAVKFNPVHIEMGYTFYKSIARGYDQSGEKKETSDESDLSYEQHGFYGSIEHSFQPAGHEFTPGIEIDISHRVYISEKSYSIDPLHVGRDEWNWTIEPDAIFYMTRALWTRISMEFSARKAYSEINPEIPALRDFERTRSTITVGWDF